MMNVADSGRGLTTQSHSFVSVFGPTVIPTPTELQTPLNRQHSQQAGLLILRLIYRRNVYQKGGKPRDAYLPASVERDLQQFQNSQNIAPKDPFVDLEPRGVRADIKRVAQRTAEETGTSDFNHVSSHDLRRRFAQRLLVDENMNPRVVMAVGGWDSFQAIEPYLNAPSPDVVDDAFDAAEL
ncbi:site-specific integrase [Salinarchaeum sp. IM2453]|uniref:site-specific integrase n=1 Tax=Salinarchaeum sp. IM2453 TaxID=2862870 RepID=UPI001C82C747|nr:site-specific integrase [Salinarchaeum sp. IM2453]QZA88499.1 site-specific integrase [Salinarchaeum sp. IM2453]